MQEPWPVQLFVRVWQASKVEKQAGRMPLEEVELRDELEEEFDAMSAATEDSVESRMDSVESEETVTSSADTSSMAGRESTMAGPGMVSAW